MINIPSLDLSQYQGQALITFSYSDGRKTNIKSTLPLHAKYAVPACLAIAAERALCPSYHDRFMDAADIRTAHAAGAEICSHAYTQSNKLVDLCAHDRNFELEGSKRVLESMIGAQAEINTLFVPYSAHDDECMLQACEYYDFVRIAGRRPNDPLKAHPQSMVHSVSIKKETGFDEVKNLIDQAIATKQWLVLGMHGVDSTSKISISEQFLDLILAYVHGCGTQNILPVRFADVSALRAQAKKQAANKPYPKIPTNEALFHYPLQKCTSMDDFYQRFEKRSASYCIALNQLKLDLELLVRDTRTLVFMFSGAGDRSKIIDPPYFMARKISQDENTNATCVYMSDPFLYTGTDSALGWYAGTTHNPLQTIIADLIAFLCDQIGPKRVMFFGGSGGGFASLYFSRKLPNATCLTWNPQLILENYYAGIVGKYASRAYGCDINELKNHITTDLPAYYEATQGTNRIILMQNITDTHHMERHVKPFLKAQGLKMPQKISSTWLSKTLYLHLTDWVQGHKPPPVDILRYLLSACADPDCDLSDADITNFMEQAELMAART